MTLLGLLCGMAAARALGHSPAVVWLVFLLLTALHVAANYMAMRTLRLRTLNAQRLHLLLRAFIHGARRPARAGQRARVCPSRASPVLLAGDDRGLTVPAIAAQERILPMPWQANALGGRVELGCALHDVANAAGVPWKRLCDQFRGSRYMLALAP
ncbi:MAG: RUS1 family protein, partial [Thermomonas sp.]